MDESIADQVTRDEWEASYKLAERLFKEQFPDMLASASDALAPLLENNKAINVVDEQTTKLIQENQAAIMMLRAAAFKSIENK